MFSWLLPPYAKDQSGVGTQLIGLLLLANAITVVLAQVPIARFAEGRRRVVMMALASWLFVFACLLVIAAGFNARIAYAALASASIIVAIGECFHTAVLMPLVADPGHAGAESLCGGDISRRRGSRSARGDLVLRAGTKASRGSTADSSSARSAKANVKSWCAAFRLMRLIQT